VPEALRSGRTWKEDPEGNPVEQVGLGRPLRRWVRDDDERKVKAIFKWPRDARGYYGVGVERLAYFLADHLGLPVPVTHLEECDGVAGSVQILVPGIAWKHAKAGVPWLLDNVDNAATWPLAVVFDLWIGNTDRHERNVMVRPEPPDRRPAQAGRCTTWLVDHGYAFLSPPTKCDPNVGRVEGLTIPPDGAMMPAAEENIKNAMPEPFRASFEGSAADERQVFLDRIRSVPQDLIVAAVEEIPAPYFSRAEQDVTKRFLTARRDSIATLANTVFPL
jgi:hypothetical protein